MSDEIAERAPTDRPLAYLVTTTGRRHLPYLVGAFLSTLVATVLDRADVFVLGIAFDAMFNDQSYVLPLFPDGMIPTTPMDQLWFTVGLLLVMKAGDIAAANISQVMRGIFSQRVLDSVRIDAFDTAQHLELGFFNDSQTGDVMSILNNDVNTLEEFLSGGITWLLRTTLVLVTVLVFMSLLNWQLALFVVASAPLIAGVNWWFSRVQERLQNEIRSETGALNARLETSLSGIDVVKTSTAEPFESEQVESASYGHLLARWESKRISARHHPSIRLISGSALVVTFLVGGFWVATGPPWPFSGALTAGQLIPFLFYTQQLASPMRQVPTLVEQYKRSQAAARRILGLKATETTVADPEDPSPLESADGHVTYDAVTFSYPSAEERTIDGVSFEVEPGETVGLVGSTGAGKSTLIKLLLRFYDVQDGAITLDGRDIASVPRKQLRKSIGYVNQDPFLFHGTVMENIAYGDLDADDAAIEAAAKAAGAHRFITDLDDGYDTEVGQRGTKLSGGQRQRIAIARAILSDPPIMVFDEATSHVDNETEVLIQRNLDELTADRTTFVIAHRLSTVRDADRIVVLDDGTVAEQGTHDDLLAAGGTYANLWNVQVGNLDALPAEFIEHARSGVVD
ncbi:ABC transporter ATP-binding protein [Halapricum hydrolyticum]|uniref:ABC transporter ATP-binding protein/permease n=1 Tax=Halapricum hydrolyticum TaxID=2979991 RepID=A0AAE3IDM0_9EURY|nr:ABC transporter ATP-binding protein [Halapricum hydrolyticum]MCU4718357.1 ABC transporter ATP-binding protein/permease [Halapricum hydrolyticum]MCU4726530.1 ABC transporter ATP-binding protein/permease [Halapricum hydrolyticum]